MGRWFVANDLHCPKCDRSDLCADDFYWRNDSGKRRVTCKACFIKDKKANYRAKAPEKRANQQAYYRENKDVYVEYKRSHPEWGSISQAKNPQRYTEKQRARNRRYQSNKRKAPGPGVSEEEFRSKLEEYNFSCAYCGCADQKLTADHVVPMSRGGMDSIENIVPACLPCNSSKKNKLVGVEWHPGEPIPFAKRSA